MTTGKKTRVNCDTYTGYEASFGLYEEQRKAIRDWMTSHDLIKHGGKTRQVGAIGGAFTYEFTPTSIGIVTTVRCSCGDTLDVSDYDQW